MEDPVMIFSGFVFLSLFLILVFMLAVTAMALVKSKKWKEHEPRVSIVIPMHNEEKNVEECLVSVKNSDYPAEKIEIIMVDDGSTDRSVEIAKKFRGVRVIKQDHKGKVDALNLGVSKASNDIVITIDCDVVVEKDFIRNIVNPFSDPDVGAVSGAARVLRPKSFLTSFQSIEYVINSLLMHSFSSVFGTSFWFWGAVTSLRKEAFRKAGGFSKKTLTEDFEIMIRMKRHGYKTISTKEAVGMTKVPEDLSSLFRQRMRWWNGTLQTIAANKDMFRPKHGIAIILLFVMQIFWFTYSFLVIPLIGYQIIYWLPLNLATPADAVLYIFKWFNLWGPFNVIYMILISEWEVSFYSIFGVASGVITLAMTIAGFWVFREKLAVRKVLSVFFYFPYTIIINVIIIIGALSYAFKRGKGTFVK